MEQRPHAEQKLQPCGRGEGGRRGHAELGELSSPGGRDPIVRVLIGFVAQQRSDRWQVPSGQAAADDLTKVRRCPAGCQDAPDHVAGDPLDGAGQHARSQRRSLVNEMLGSRLRRPGIGLDFSQRPQHEPGRRCVLMHGAAASPRAACRGDHR